MNTSLNLFYIFLLSLLYKSNLYYLIYFIYNSIKYLYIYIIYIIYTNFMTIFFSIIKK